MEGLSLLVEMRVAKTRNSSGKMVGRQKVSELAGGCDVCRSPSIDLQNLTACGGLFQALIKVLQLLSTVAAVALNR
jgi:hypothetical protein